MIDTWSDNTVYNGMPSTTDLYFTLADSEYETGLMHNAELRPISSIWGHRAGNPLQCPEDEGVLRAAVRDLLGN